MEIIAPWESAVAPTGETHAFLADGDEVLQRGCCEREGAVPIGFGEAAARVRPAP